MTAGGDRENFEFVFLLRNGDSDDLEVRSTQMGKKRQERSGFEVWVGYCWLRWHSSYFWDIYQAS